MVGINAPSELIWTSCNCGKGTGSFNQIELFMRHPHENDSVNETPSCWTQNISQGNKLLAPVVFFAELVYGSNGQCSSQTSQEAIEYAKVRPDLLSIYTWFLKFSTLTFSSLINWIFSCLNWKAQMILKWLSYPLILQKTNERIRFYYYDEFIVRFFREFEDIK